MAMIQKVLYDDHARVRRMLERYRRTPGNPMLALAIADEIAVHSEIEEELVYPAVREELDEAQADKAEEDHAEIDEIVNAIQELEPGDDDLQPLMDQLVKAINRHMAWEERVLFPMISSRLRHQNELGRQAWTLRQEALGQRPNARKLPPLQLANTGWGQSQVPNAGW